MLLKAITVMNQTMEGYTLRFWKNIFQPKYIEVVQSVQSYRVYRYLATSRNTSLLPIRCGQRGKCHFNPCQALRDHLKQKDVDLIRKEDEKQADVICHLNGCTNRKTTFCRPESIQRNNVMLFFTSNGDLKRKNSRTAAPFWPQRDMRGVGS